ncbi:MAG: cytochrome C oxidase subunit II [Edaphobacter sp.]
MTSSSIKAGLHVYSLATWRLPLDASAHGPAIDRHLLLSLWIILALAAMAHLILLIGLVARRRPEATSWRVEYLPLAALAVLFAFLTIRAERLWAVARYTGAEPTALQVQVVGEQFAWYFRYPGTDATFGITRPQLIDAGAGNPLGIDSADRHGTDDIVTSELVLPANRQVDLRLNALDVIHGFSVPEMRLKQNAVPGMTIHVHFTPEIPGTYAILCTQVCGLGHYRMNANLRILPPEQFAAWLAAKQKVVQR